MEPLATLIWLLGAAFASGVASGLFGIGGGLILVPSALWILGIPVREAVALSLLAMCLSTPIGLWPHAQAGNVRVRPGLLLGLGGLGGVLLGWYIDPYLPDTVILVTF